jgi:lipopolysaccharide export system permease protein
MKIIDRYLLGQFLRSFLICYCSLTGLYIVFDVFTNMEEFLRFGKQAGGVWRLMSAYYSCRAVVFFDRTEGLLLLVAAMFTVTWIQRHNELTALMSAGIPRFRVAKPVIVACAVISLAAAVNRELVIPRLKDQLSRTPRDLLGNVGQDLQPRYDNRTDILIRGSHTFADRQRITDPNFLLPPALDRYGNQLAAKEAFFLEADARHPRGYLLNGVQKPADLHGRPSLYLDRLPVIITPRDAPSWLRPGQCFVASDVTFDQLNGSIAWRDYSSTAQLIAGIRNPSLDFGADVRVVIHFRLVQPLLDMTLLFLGLPLVLTRESRNVFVAIGLCGAVVAGFMLVVMAFQYLGSIYSISPALAAWMPLMIFVPLATMMADAMSR